LRRANTYFPPEPISRQPAEDPLESRANATHRFVIDPVGRPISSSFGVATLQTKIIASAAVIVQAALTIALIRLT